MKGIQKMIYTSEIPVNFGKEIYTSREAKVTAYDNYLKIEIGKYPAVVTTINRYMNAYTNMLRENDIDSSFNTCKNVTLKLDNVIELIARYHIFKSTFHAITTILMVKTFKPVKGYKLTYDVWNNTAIISTDTKSNNAIFFDRADTIIDIGRAIRDNREFRITTAKSKSDEYNTYFWDTLCDEVWLTSYKPLNRSRLEINKEVLMIFAWWILIENHTTCMILEGRTEKYALSYLNNHK